MPRLLHILNRPVDEFVESILREQRADPDNVVEVVDLTVPVPDYARLVEMVFTADSVATW